MKKQTLRKTKTQYLQIVYNDIQAGKPVKNIQKDLLSIHPPVDSSPLLAIALHLAKKSKINVKDIYRANIQANKIISQELVKNESEAKQEILSNYLKQNRADKKLVYVCSFHDDCAIDHQNWQGRMYIDQYWHNYDKTGEIAQWVKANNIQTVQKITNKPVWLITRPHCRHYFVAYTFQEIMSGNYKIPYSHEGKRGILQTGRANITLDYYTDRLKVLEGLKKTEEVKLAIDKTKLLITKWKGQH